MSANPLSTSVTVFHGDNRLEISERVSSARSSVDPTGLSTSIFEQASASISDVGSAIASPGFFGADRLVVCHNLVNASSAGRRRRASKSGDESDPLSILSSVAPGVWLIIVEDSLIQSDERRLRTFRESITVERVQTPRGRALIDWTCERARRHQTSIDGAAATRLVEALFPGSWRHAARRDDIPPDLHRLDGELAKLSAAAGSSVEITAELINELTPNADELDIWGLSNAIADRDQSRAIKQLEIALETGQPPEMILAQLSAQFETFAVLNAARERPIGETAARTGLNEGRLRQAGRSSRNFTRAFLKDAITEIRTVDFGIKQGYFEPDDTLSSLVAGLSRRR